MSTASTPQTTGTSGQTPTQMKTPSNIDFDTGRVEELFEEPLNEYNIHTPEASMASHTDNLLICTMVDIPRSRLLSSKVRASKA